MRHVALCLLLPIIDAFLTVKIIRNSFYSPDSLCAFLGNATLATDASLQTCIWKCAHENECQTAVYFNDGRICWMYAEFYQRGHIIPSGNVRASVLCYRKDHSKSLFLILYDQIDRFVFQIPS